MSVLYDDVQNGPVNIQEYKSFEIYAITIDISMTELISPLNKQSGLLFILTQQSMGRSY